MDATNSNERLLTDKEVGALLGISRASVWNRVKDGTIQKPLKFGRSSRFPQSDILGSIDAAKQQRAA
ncbi:helix-turn-helix transcriptional regulator [Agrobacterium cavarae]|uniref:helix-turn-helix transcriptional regulator n=1 Tax=Agrobacterium cavarae TaxID=2528239 RepID=UPI002FD8BA1D